MKFTTTNFNGKDVRVSVEAETSAEVYQLKALRDKLFDEGAHCIDWNDMEGGRGICLVVEMMPNVQIKGLRAFAQSLLNEGLCVNTTE